MNPETPEADAVEQAQQDEAVPEEDGPTGAEGTAWDADPADLADQQRTEPADDDYDRD